MRNVFMSRTLKVDITFLSFYDVDMFIVGSDNNMIKTIKKLLNSKFNIKIWD